jgi:hypothetical protein
MDDNFNDYFEEEGVPEEKPQVETPEQREEREIKEATIERRHNKMRITLLSIIAFIVLVVVGWVWLRYFHSFRESQETGRIMEVANEGTIFKTYEGKMISEKYIADTIHVYQSDFDFTIDDDSVARQLMKLSGTGRKVTLSYREYHGTLPWRGNTSKIVTKVEEDTVGVN